MKPNIDPPRSVEASRLLVALTGLAIGLSNTAQAVDAVKANTTTMNLTTDWVGGVVPTVANALRPSWNNNAITAANNLLITLGGDIACNGMDLRPVGSSGATLKIGAGNTLGLMGTVAQQDNGGWDSTLDCGIQLVGNTTFSLQGDIIINGSITQDATPRSLSKMSQGGAMHLTAANSYTGGTNISAGILTLGGSGTLGATTGNLTFGPPDNPGPGALDLGGTTQTVKDVDLSGAFIQNGTIISTSLYKNGPGLVSANLQGGAAVTMAAGNSGGTILSGTNTYGGATTISGWLRATKPAALPNSGATPNVITISSGSAYLAVRAGAASGEWASGNIDNLLANPTFTVSSAGGALGIDTTGGDFSYGSVIPAKTNLGFRKIGPNTLTLTAANLYPQKTTVARGTLKIDAGAGASLFSTSALTFAGTGTFNYDNTTAAGTTTQTLGALNVVAASANDNSTTATEATVQLTRTAEQTTALKFASLAPRVTGGTLNFKVAGTPGTNGTDSKIWFTTGPTVSTFIDQGTFFGGSGYAINDSSSFLRAMNYASDTDAASVGSSSTDFTTAAVNGKHVDLGTAGSISAGSTESIKSLRIGGTNGVTLGAGNTLTLASGGILKTGGNASTITGGTGLFSPNELVLRTDSANDKLIINSAITPTRVGTTAAASPIVTGLSHTSNLTVGMAVVVTGGATTTIFSVDNANQITLAANAGFTGTPLIRFGNATVTKSGEGTLELGGVNTFNHLRVNAGRLNFTSSTNLPATAALTIGEGTTLDNTSGANLTVGGGGLDVRVAGSFTYLGTGGDLTLGTDGNFRSLPNDSTITVVANTFTFVKELANYYTAAVTKEGAGTLRITGNGQTRFVGGLTINNGVMAGGVNDNANQTAGLGLVTLGNTSGANPATLYLANGSDNSSPLIVRSGSSGTLALVSEFSKSPRWNGPVTLNNALTLASINGTSGTLNLYGVISGSGGLNIGNTGSIVVASATKTLVNQGIVRLFRANDYTGNTLVNSGTLKLAALAKIDSTPLISLAAGTTLDVSAIAAYTLSPSTTLAAKGTGTTVGTTAARIYGASGGTVSLGAQPVSLTFTPTSGSGDTTHPSLVVSQGSLTLSGNTLSVVNNGPALGTGVYRLIQTPGAITGVPNTAAVTVTGSGGLAANSEAFATVSGNDVILTVSTKLLASFSGLTLSQSIQAGTADVTLSGTVSAPGPTYPADGETVHVTINGVTNDTTTSGGTGSFSIAFPTSTLPGSAGGISYPITYTYDTSATLTAATNNATALTVTTQTVPTITSWPTSAGLIYGDDLTVATLTGGSANVPGTFTYTAPATVPVAVGSYLASGKFTPDDTGSYSTVIVPDVISVPVSQKELTIDSPAVTTRAYNAGLNAAITGTLTGVLSGDVGLVTLVGTGLFETALPAAGIAVDASTSTITGSKSSNYSLTVPTGLTGTITAATLTVKADDKSRAAGAANPTLTSTVTGYQGADTAGSVGLMGTPVLATAALITDPAGNYPITCAAGDVTITDPNYTLDFVDGTLEVVGLATWAKGSDAWDIRTSLNWKNPALTPVTYLDGGEVLFADTVGFASPFTVTLNTTVGPASVTMNNPTKDYTISGTGVIAGAGSLTKTGAGALTLATANTYSGGTTVDACSLTLSKQTGFGTGPVTLAAGTTFQQTDFEGNGAPGALPNAFVLSGIGKVIMNMPFSFKDVWLSQPVTGTGGFTVQGGDRSLTLIADNSFSGGVTLQNFSNRIQISHVNALGTGTFRSETTAANGGQLVPLTDLSAGAGVGNAVDIASGAYLNVFANGSNHLKLSGVISSAVGTGNLYKSGSGILTLSGANTYSGNTTVNAGTLSLAAGGQLKFVLGATSGVSNSISGAGTAVLDGNFLIDTTAAAALTSGTWTLENVNSLTGVYGPNFSVVGFAPHADGDTWTMTEPSKTWTFVESTGVLTLAAGSDYTTWAGFYPGVDLTDPAADLDGDGMTNQQEYAFGLNPTTGSSVSPVTPLIGTQFTYTRRAASGLIYTVEYSADLTTWNLAATTEIPGAANSEGVQSVAVTITNDPVNGKLFVRVLAAPAP